jgi:hypothetical protein
MRQRSNRLMLLSLVASAAACSAPPNPMLAPSDESTTARMLGFVRDQVTTRGEAEFRMGSPSARYEYDRTLVFAVGEVAGVSRVVPLQGGDVPPTAPLYHLVLVFDEAGILQRHSLVRVR